MTIAVRSINTPDFNLQQVQTNLINVLRQIASKDIIDGLLLSDVDVKTVPTVFNHTLGRVPLGYFIVGKSGPGDVYQPSAPNSLMMTLQSTTETTVSLWVF